LKAQKCQSLVYGSEIDDSKQCINSKLNKILFVQSILKLRKISISSFFRKMISISKNVGDGLIGNVRNDLQGFSYVEDGLIENVRNDLQGFS